MARRTQAFYKRPQILRELAPSAVSRIDGPWLDVVAALGDGRYPSQQLLPIGDGCTDEPAENTAGQLPAERLDVERSSIWHVCDNALGLRLDHVLDVFDAPSDQARGKRRSQLCVSRSVTSVHQHRLERDDLGEGAQRLGGHRRARGTCRPVSLSAHVAAEAVVIAHDASCHLVGGHNDHLAMAMDGRAIEEGAPQGSRSGQSDRIVLEPGLELAVQVTEAIGDDAVEARNGVSLSLSGGYHLKLARYLRLARRSMRCLSAAEP